MSEIVKKITLKGVCGEFEAPEKGKTTPLMAVYGLVKGAKSGQTTYGDFIRFVGNFEAVNLATGESVVSGSMILPAICESLLFGALGSDDITGVQFAFEIGIKADKTPTGYAYTVKSLIPTSVNDPLSDLRSKIALPAPGEMKTISAPVSKETKKSA